jgi:hypothetical protein
VAGLGVQTGVVVEGNSSRLHDIEADVVTAMSRLPSPILSCCLRSA